MKKLLLIFVIFWTLIALAGPFVYSADYIFQNSTGSNLTVIKGDTGNVGIGTITPQNTLNVIGNANITGIVYSMNDALPTWTNITNGTLATWIQVMNGTVVKNTSLTSYLTNYYSITNPYGFYNSTTNPGIISGAGSYGYLPMWNGTNSLNTSNIYQNKSNIGIGTTNPSYLLHVNGDLGVNNINFLNPGIGGDSRLTFIKTNDQAWISVKEVTSDSTTYGFYMADNPDGTGDQFLWQVNDWQGTGGDWQPLQFSNMDANIRASDINAFGTYSIYGPWYSGPTGTPNTMRVVRTGNLNLSVDVSAYTGDTQVYWLVIDGTGSPNTFKWGRGQDAVGGTNGVTVATGVPITGSAQALESGITVTFNSTTGGAINDTYQFRASKGGKILVSNGSAAAPSFSFTGDTNTGLYSGGADTLRIATGGADRATINNVGNFGINTTTPQNTLNVLGDANITGMLRDSSGGSSGANLIPISADAWRDKTTMWSLLPSGSAATISIVDPPAGSLPIPTGKVDQFVNLSNSGEWYAIDQIIPVNSNVTYYGRVWAAGISGGGAFYAGYIAYNSTGSVLAGNGGTYGYFIASSVTPAATGTWYYGKVGGEGSAVSTFPVGTRYIKPVVILNYNTGGIMDVGGFEITDVPFEQYNGAYDLATNATSRLYIDPSGRIGIATTTPQNTLNVLGNVNITGTLYAGAVNFSVNLANTTSGSGTANYIPMWNGTNSLNNSVIYQNGSNVGIGTTNPGASLGVSGNAVIGINQTTPFLYFGGTNSSYPAIKDNGGGLELRLADDSNYATLNANTITAVGSGSNLRIYNSAQGAQFLLCNNGACNVGLQHTGTAGIVGVTSGVSGTYNGTLIAGMIGINTTTPQNALNVFGDLNVTGTIYGGAFNFTSNNFTSGSGTANYIPMWNGTNSLNNSNIYQNGSNIGIGTTTPGAMLEVNGSIYPTIGDTYNIGTATSANRYAAVYATTFSSGSSGTGLRLNTGAAQPIQFQINSVEKARIDTLGNFGIGTTGPTSTLHINSSNTNSSFYVQNTTLNNVQLFINGSTGYVGIGTTNASSLLNVVNGTIRNTGGASRYGIEIDGSNVGGPRINMGTEAGLSTFMTFGAYNSINNLNTTTRDFRLYSTTQTGLDFNASSGYFGINTITPNRTLSVNGSISLASNNFLGSGLGYDCPSCASFSTLQLYNGSTGSVALQANYALGNIFLLPGSSGNVGIGTTAPTAGLSVNSSNANGSFFVQNTTAGNAQLFINGTTGNVGIGTPSPGFKLDLEGIAPNSTDGLHVQSVDNHWARLFPSLGNSNYNPIVQAGDEGLIFSSVQSSGGFVIAPWTNTIGGLRIGTNGNVGINTTSPKNTLNVIGGFNISNVSGSTSLFVNESSGYVGIGTANPQNQLQVSGAGNQNIAIDSTNSFSPELLFNQGGTTQFKEMVGLGNNFLLYDKNSNIRFAINQTTGNVGINTTSPQNSLNVIGDLNVTGTIYGGAFNSSVGFANTTSGSGTYGYIPVWNGTNSLNNSVIYQNGSNISIGTTNAITPLYIKQPNNGANVLTIQRSADTSESGNLLQFLRADGTVASAFGADGQLAIGNSYVESYQNTWSGAPAGWFIDSANGNNLLIGTESGKNIYIYPQGTGKTFILGGNLGINTTAPNQTLDVNGNIYASGNFKFNDANGSILIGTNTGNTLLYTTALGYQAGYQNIGSQLTSLGFNSSNGNIADYVTTVGRSSGYQNNGSSLTALGWQSGYNNSGGASVGVGYQALYNNSGLNVVALGYQAGYSNNNGGVTVVGAYSGYKNIGDQLTSLGSNSAYQNNGSQLTALGNQAGYNNSGNWSTGVGYQALYNNSGHNTAVLGYQAGYSNNASSVTAIGSYSGYQNTGSYVTAIGSNSANNNSGNQVTALGWRSGNNNSGSSSTGVGYQALYNNSGNNVVALGYQAGYSNNASAVTGVGVYSGYLNTGSSVTALGVSSAYNNTGSSVTALGWQAGYNNTGSLSVGVGYQALFNNTGGSITGIGYQSGDQNTANQLTALGYQSGYANTGLETTALGYQSGYNNSAYFSTFSGYQAGYNNKNNYLTAFGSQSGYANTGTPVTALGHQAGYTNTGWEATLLGYQSGYNNTANYVTTVGQQAGYFNTGANIATLGYQSGYNNTGIALSALGYQSGYNNSGNNVVTIGYQAGMNNSNANQFIVQQANVNAIPLIQGNFSSGYVGIGTTTPQNTLNVLGDLNITGKIYGGAFNSSGSLSGSGSYGYIPMWNGTTSLNNSGIYQNAVSNAIGIGTTSPAGAFQVQGDQYIGYQNGSAASSLYFYEGSHGSAGTTASIRADYSALYLTNGNGPIYVEDATDSAHSLRIQEGGSPWGNLQWWYDGSSGTGTGMWMATSSSAGSMNFQMAGSPGNSSFNVFDVNNNPLLIVNNSGNVGVGIKVPTSTFQINSSNANSSFFVQNTTVGNSQLFINGTTGNIGIGTTTPGNILNLVQDNTYANSASGQFMIQGTNRSKRLAIGLDTTNNYAWINSQLSGDGAYPLILNPSGGNVGIGTTVPNQTLDIVGKIYASGNFKFNDSNQSIVIGTSTGSTLSFVTALGNGATISNTGNAVTAVGWDAGASNIKDYLTAVGYGAGYANIGDSVTATGAAAGQFNNGSLLTASGSYSAYNNSGNSTTASGYYSAYNNSGSYLTALGVFSGQANNGSYVTALGPNSAYYNNGSYVTATGFSSGYQNTADYLTALGYGSGYQNKGSSLTASGYQSGYNNTGSYSTVSGYQSGYNNIASYLTAVGMSSGYNNTANSLTALGAAAGYSNTGSFLTSAGFESGYQNSGSSSTTLGALSGYKNNGDYLSALGYQAASNNSGSYVTASGYYSAYLNNASYVTASGSYSAYNNNASYVTASGYQSGYNNTGNYLTSFGYQAGMNNTGPTLIAIGPNAGQSNTGSSVITIGASAGQSNTGGGLVGIGPSAGYQNIGNYLTAVGQNAGYQNNGSYVTSSGYQSSYQNIGNYLTAVGINSGFQNTGNATTAIGASSGQGNNGSYLSALGFASAYLNNGSYLSALGYQAGGYNTGNNVVALGYQAGWNNSLSNQFIVQQSNVNAVPLIQGNFSSGNVGIGTATPQNKLNVIGDLNVTGKIYGGASNLTTTNFTSGFGTANYIPMWNGTTSLNNSVIYQNGSKIGIGMTTPNRTLEVSNAFAVSGGNAVIDLGQSGGTGGGRGEIQWNSNLANNYLVLTAYNESNSRPILFNPYGGNVGIGTLAPNQTLDVGGKIYASGNFQFNDTNGSLVIGTSSSGTLSFTTAVGYNAGYQNSGNQLTAFGTQAAYQNNVTGVTAIGYSAANTNIGSFLTAVGQSAGALNTGTQNVGVGGNSLYNNTGSQVTALGFQAGYGNIAGAMTGVGYDAGYGNSGSYVSALGYQAGYGNSGSGFTALGYQAGYSNNAAYLTALGYLAGYNNSGNNVVALGYQAGMNNALANQFIVQQANVNSIPLIQGNFSSGYVGIGTATPQNTLNVVGGINVTGVYTNVNLSTNNLTLTNGTGAGRICLNQGCTSYIYNNGTGVVIQG